MYLINKQIGETPLEALERFRHDKAPLYDDLPLSYAGRLDPMAEGLLLILVGKENKNREKYLNFDKTYEVEILFGLESDTYDVLGEITCSNLMHTDMDDLRERIEIFLKDIEGEFVQPYPPYSSKPVNGKPLFEWAREGRLNEITIPTNTVNIYEAQLLKIYEASFQGISENAIENIKKVTGNFRQESVIESWNEIADKYPDVNVCITKIRISCSSGTYMRSIARLLGQKVGTGALALSIRRTEIKTF